MNRLLLAMALVWCNLPLIAQSEIKYDNPPSVKTTDYRIDAVDIVATEDYCKLKLIIQNTTKDAYFLFASDELGFDYDGIGTYWTKRSKELVVFPGDKESRVIKVAGDMDYRKDHFNLLVNGLKKGFFGEYLSGSPFSIKMDQVTTVDSDGIKLNVVKATSKKGKVSLQIEVSYESDNDDMIVFTPSSVQFKANGELVTIESSDTKPVALRPGDTEKLKYSLLSEADEITCQTDGVFGRVDFTPIEVDPVRVGYPKDAVFVDAVSTPVCDPFMGTQTGMMKVKVYSPDGTCFRLDIDGFPVINKMTGNAIIYVDSGRRSYKLTTSKGTTYEGKIMVPSTQSYSQVGYKVKPTKDGAYSLKYAANDQVMTQAAIQERQDFFDKADREREERFDNMLKKEDEEKETQNAGSGSSSGGNCFGEPSTGMTELKLKVTWKGNPVAGHEVEIRYGGVAIGNSVTDSDGVARIKSSKYDDKMPKVDVYGCKGSTNWSVKGDWVVFNSSEYFHLELDEVAKVMAELMGMTIDEIGAGWGM